jgi:proline dehydrogenase
VLRPFFIALSRSRGMRALAERSPLGLRVSRRFVAGTTIEQGMAATRELNAAGMAVTLDHLGENVTNADEARSAAQAYHEILDAIEANGLNANVSCKLTNFGIDIDPQLCRELVCSLVTHAVRNRGFVRVDMEGSAYTQRSLDLVYELHRSLGDTAAQPGTPAGLPAPAVGAVIQSYLRRSQADVEQLCSAGIRVRLVKGAYKEPADLAFPRKADVDANFIRLTGILLKSGSYHAIATHDERIIEEVIAFAGREKISPEAFEFQMLYGVRRDLQQRLVRVVWRVRVYVPFGTEWYPYFMRRLAERPANVWFIVKSLFQES